MTPSPPLYRFNNVRHNTLGIVWGAVENIALHSHQLFGRHFQSSGPEGEQARQLHNTVVRYCNAVFRLLFLAAQGQGDMSGLGEFGCGVCVCVCICCVCLFMDKQYT